MRQPLPSLVSEVKGMRMSSKLSQLMRDLIRVCHLQAYEHLPLTYLHAATNPLVLGILTHPDLPFVVLGYVQGACKCGYRYPRVCTRHATAHTNPHTLVRF